MKAHYRGFPLHGPALCAARRLGRRHLHVKAGALREAIAAGSPLADPIADLRYALDLSERILADENAIEVLLTYEHARRFEEFTSESLAAGVRIHADLDIDTLAKKADPFLVVLDALRGQP